MTKKQYTPLTIDEVIETLKKKLSVNTVRPIFLTRDEVKLIVAALDDKSKS